MLTGWEGGCACWGEGGGYMCTQMGYVAVCVNMFCSWMAVEKRSSVNARKHTCTCARTLLEMKRPACHGCHGSGGQRHGHRPAKL